MSKKIVEQAKSAKFKAPTFTIEALNHIVSADACVVELTAVVGNNVHYITGSARRNRGDRSNLEVGYFVALARAMSSLSRKLDRQATGLVKHADDVQAERRARLAAAAQNRRANNAQTTTRRRGRTGVTTAVRRGRTAATTGAGG